jgi:2-nitrobenzoate nitroreductase
MEGLSRAEKFRLVTGSVMPRPIALVTTSNADGSCNAAPFSAFNYMCDDPPLLAIGVDSYGEESGREGETKDTLRNMLERNEFVVNMVDTDLVDRAVACATDYPAGLSETELLGLELAGSHLVAVARLAAAPISWECQFRSKLDVSPLRAIVIGEILAMHFKEALFDAYSVRVNVDQYFPVGRLGGPNYAMTSDRIRIPILPYRPHEKPEGAG